MRYLKRLTFGGTGAGFTQPVSWLSSPWWGGLAADRESIEADFESYCANVFKESGPVFGTILVRHLVFSEAEFLWRDRMANGAYGDLFSDSELELLQHPWPGATTGELLARMEQDASIAGNFYATIVDNDGKVGRAATGRGRRLARMRPHQVEIIIGSASGDPNAIDAQVVGYKFTPNGGGEPILLLPNEVCHYSPIPDPEARFRGMSWLTPIIEEILGDQQMTQHKKRFFRQGAHLQQAITFAKDVQPAVLKEFIERYKAEYGGTANAYKTLVLAGGADVKPIQADLKNLEFRAVQGHAEARIAMAGGVPPILAGMVEGLDSSTYSNYGSARRRFADGTMRPLWRIASASLQQLLTPPTPMTRLWYDDRGISFLREDLADVVQIQAAEAATIRQLVDAGYTPESVVKALRENDWRRLAHSGLFSVQLQTPGAGAPALPQGGQA